MYLQLLHPNRNSESKLPILEMEVWLNEDGLAVYRDYEKPMANRQIIEEQSALSAGCKQAVHVNEVARRILNTSIRLEWLEYVAVTDYICLNCPSSE